MGARRAEREELEPAAIDFAAAALYLDLARTAHESGDERRFIAARHLVLVALGIEPIDVPR